MKLFVDTGAWAALENSEDIHYHKAISFKYEIKNKRYRLYTSNFVLDETYTLLLANVGFRKTVEFKKRIESLKEIGLLHVIRIDDEIETLAWSIFERFNKDKFWSFTDCTSKAIMDMLEILEVFSFDRNFDQMGLIRKP